ncbi:hypothetical protein scyTo_0017931 [Scyliorhinus torazame]|uniref:Uncharacterized protein n=1 Tax=Scyliorhinus torazame TaxID=75743 RepID=A0A401Q2T9_SCYTO|nr:hypothetical protein [Scyliorhinus torazame]
MKRRKKCHTYAPGPRGLPFIGNIHQVDLSNPHLSFAKVIPNSEIRETKVHDVIDSVVGKERKPTLEDREEMPYTNAVIHETQSFGNIVPISLPHETYRDTEVMGYTIPKGTTVIPNLSSAMFDENIWSTPHQFNPGHFINSEGKVVKPEAFIAFSAGRRVCPGEQLAKAKLFLFFTSIFQRFTFHLPENKPTPSYTEANTAITLSPLPYRLLNSDKVDGDVQEQ